MGKIKKRGFPSIGLENPPLEITVLNKRAALILLYIQIYTWFHDNRNLNQMNDLQWTRVFCGKRCHNRLVYFVDECLHILCQHAHDDISFNIQKYPTEIGK